MIRTSIRISKRYLKRKGIYDFAFIEVQFIIFLFFSKSKKKRKNYTKKKKKINKFNVIFNKIFNYDKLINFLVKNKKIKLSIFKFCLSI